MIMDTRSIKFASVFIATIAIMLFSQGDLAYADGDLTCENQILSGNNDADNIFVKGFCEFDGVNVTAQIEVTKDSFLVIYGASEIKGDIVLTGEFSEVYFEGTSAEINTLIGNIKGDTDTTFVYIEALDMTGHIDSKGEIHINSDNRFSGPVEIDGTITSEGTDIDLTIIGNSEDIEATSVLQDIKASKLDSVRIFDVNVGGDMEIKENQDVIITGNTVGKNLKVEKNEVKTDVSDNTITEKLDIIENSGCTQSDNTASESKIEGC